MLTIGKHVGEEPDATQADETIGFLVIEAGSGAIGGLAFAAAVGGDACGGADDAPPYAYASGTCCLGVIEIGAEKRRLP